MRPATLSEACERIIGYGARDAEARLAVVREEPAATGDARRDAFVAAAAEYFARQYRLGRIPAWVFDPSRRLDEPWFTTTSKSPGLREFLAFPSPAEFRSRNILTEERPLRRASQGARLAEG